jgi:hypothetical protein
MQKTLKTPQKACSSKSISKAAGYTNNILISMHNGKLFTLKNEGEPVLCKNMDETGIYYAKLNNPDI